MGRVCGPPVSRDTPRFNERRKYDEEKAKGVQRSLARLISFGVPKSFTVIKQ